jgi:hypothetical protein
MYRPYGTSFGDGARAGINKLPGNLGVNSGTRLNWYGGTEIALQKAGNSTIYTFFNLAAGSYFLPLEAVGQSSAPYLVLGDNGESRYLQYKLSKSARPNDIPLNVIGKNAGARLGFKFITGTATARFTMCGYDGFDRKVVGVSDGSTGIVAIPGFFNKITSIFMTLSATATIDFVVHRGAVAWDAKSPFAANTLNVPGDGAYSVINATSAGYQNPPFINQTAYLNIYRYLDPYLSATDNSGVAGNVQFWGVSQAGSGIEQNMNIYLNNETVPTKSGFPAGGYQPSEVRTALSNIPNYNLNWIGWNG